MRDVGAASRCGNSKTSAYVGFKGPLVNTEHQIGGEFEVLDDCTFQVSNFTYDGQAPATYWWCGSSTSAFSSGSAANDWLFTGVSDGSQTLVLELKEGLTWEMCKAVSAWCTHVSADLGHVELAPAAQPPAAASRCGHSKTSAYVGFKGPIVNGEHQIGGEFEVLDDCTFQVSNFTYDGQAPATYWWCGSSTSAFSSGSAANDWLFTGVSDGSQTLVLELKEGLTWEMCKAVSAWCTHVSADLGHVELAPAAQPPAAASRCGHSKTSAYVGFKGPIVNGEHQIGGEFEVLDDCTFQVSNFTYDGQAPATYWWCGSSTSAFSSGSAANDWLFTGVSDGSQTLVLELKEGLTWEMCKAVSAWCTHVSADLGHVELAPAAQPPAAASRCGHSKTSAYVGFKGPIVNGEHQIGGEFEVLDDCTFQVSNFTYDGQAPATYWWCGSSTSAFSSGSAANDWLFTGVSDGSQTLVLELKEGLTWEMCKAVSAWCTHVSADLGHVELAPAAQPPAASRCGHSKTSAYVGFKGPIVNGEHQIGGEFEVLDDCTFQVSNFTYDGQAPATYWWCGSSTSAFSSGSAANDWLFTGVSDGSQTLVLELKEGLTWEMCKAVSAWCTHVSADLGHVELAPAAQPPAAASRCGHSKTSAYVGFKGPIVNGEHQIGGEFEVLDDCTFQVSNFTYDGQAPATYWWCGSSTSAFSSGSAANDWLFTGVSDGSQTLVLELKEGLTWEMCKAVSAWCTHVSADLGHVELAPAAQPPAASRCGHSKTSAYVGFKGPIVNGEHQIGGEFEVLDDCTFQVSNFTYDGQAPATYWWCGSSTSAFSSGSAANDWLFTGVSDGSQTLVLELKEGLTWEMCKAVSAWCTHVSADLGHVELAPAAQPPAAASRCGHSKTSAIVGFKGPIVNGEHQIGGEFEVLDDCTFQVSNFTYDGQAPATYWWCGSSTSAFSSGSAANDWLFTGVSDGSQTLVLELKEGLTWEMCKAVSAWCTHVSADLGHVELAPAAQPPAAASRCGHSKTSAIVGFKGPIVNGEHQIGGEFEVLDDCTFQVSNFTYDGQAPATYWWCGSSTSAFSSGSAANDWLFTGVSDGSQTLVLELKEGLTWEMCKAVSAWCTHVSADLGHVELAPAAQPPAAASRCGHSKTSAYVGFKGPIVNGEHQIGGDFEVLDDCTFKVSMFSYDGQAPATYWWCGSSTSAFSSGSAANDWLFSDVSNGYRTLVLELKEGLTWETCKAVSAWCTHVSADLGHVELVPAAQAPALPNRLPDAMTDTMVNCRELQPGVMNVYWTLDSDDVATAGFVRMTLQGALPPTDWMGLGFNSPDLDSVEMVGSDVVIAGLLPSLAPFVDDYFLGSRMQCAYNTPGQPGVCPDNYYTNSSGSNNVKLLGMDRRNGVTSITFLRPLKAVDAEYDHDWPTASARPVTFAHGPLNPTSTAERPVVLYHGPSNHAAPDATLNLGDKGFSCPTPIGTPGGTEPPLSTQPSPSPAAPNGSDSNVLFGRTSITVTEGPNPNYPNPPAWGLSYHLDGLETPVLKLFRGVTYTFNIQAGNTHPIYLTSDINGGRSNSGETVYAGGAASFGTAQKPGALSFTPNASTPSEFFYQCWNHQKLGWRVKVIDSDDGGACSKTHPFVGFSSPLTSLDGKFAASLTVVDDCTFSVTGLKYDGAAADASWYGAATADASAFKAGWELAAYTAGAANTVRMSNGASWDQIGAIGFYSKSKNALMGVVMLGAPSNGTSPSAGASPSPAPAASPSPSPSGSSPKPMPSVSTPPPPPPPMRWCSTRSSFVGYQISLHSRAHGLSGIVTVVDTCTIRISKFTHDGMAPDPYWFGADKDRDSAFDAGTILTPYTGGAADGTGPDIIITLPRGVSFPSLRAISFYCKSTALNLASAPLAEKCGSSSPLVGFTAPLMGMQHVAYGTFKILDDCTASVEDFIYDGQAPDAFWKVGPSATNFSYAAGARMLLEHSTGAANRSAVVLRLGKGMTWGKTIRGLSFYSEAVAMSMATVAIPSAPCKASHAAVGAFIPLMPVAHVTYGTLEIRDDCTGIIHDLLYDGAAPDIHIRLAPEDSDASFKSAAAVDVLPWLAGQAAAARPMTIVFKLPPGQSWSSLKAVSVWCRSVAANMASAPVLPKCGRSPLSGSRLSLAPVVHVAPGAQVAVLDTCTIQITGFTYDGAAPDLTWQVGKYGAPNDTAAAYNHSAAVLLMAWTAGAVHDATVYLRLPAGMSLSAMGGLSAWSPGLGLNMGSVALAPGCGRTHALIGASSPLTALEHVSPGAMVTVVDDCTIRVDGFTYDGLAPDAFWVAGANDSTAAYNASAMVLSPMWTGGAATASTVFIRLPPGVTLDDVPALSFFCKTMAVNMASTPLLKGCAPTKGAKPRPEVGRTYYFRAFAHVSPGASLRVLDECTLLIEGLTYDGLAPDAFWVAAHADSTAAYNASTAVTISAWTHGAVTSGSLKLKLPKGVTWRSINGISFFSKAMGVNMASVALV